VTGNTPSSARTRFLTVFEVATIMRVSKRTIYRLVHAGDLEAIKVGGSFRIPEHAVKPRGLPFRQARHGAV
jgi:excisionase family DNA binding protein